MSFILRATAKEYAKDILANANVDIREISPEKFWMLMCNPPKPKINIKVKLIAKWIK